MDDSPLPLSATFPPPPPHHALFTNDNLAHSDDPAMIRQLQPPRVDWIQQDGGYDLFGDFYPIPAHVPSVVEMGLPALTNSAAPPAPALRSLLHAYLQTYSSLLHALTKPPPPLPQSQQQADEWRVGIKEVQRLAEVGVNMIVRVNELRGEQAKATLEGLLQAQISRRKEETRALRTRCTEISASLAALRSIPPPTSSLDEPSLDFAAALKVAEKSRAQIASGLAGKEEEKRAGEGDVPAEESKRKDELEMLDLLDLI